MNSKQIAEMLRSVLRLNGHDAAIKEWSKPGEPNAAYWQSDNGWYTGRDEDEKALDQLRTWGELSINDSNNHATIELCGYFVWYSLCWGWGVQQNGKDIYSSSDSDEEAPMLPIATGR